MMTYSDVTLCHSRYVIMISVLYGAPQVKCCLNCLLTIQVTRSAVCFLVYEFERLGNDHGIFEVTYSVPYLTN